MACISEYSQYDETDKLRSELNKDDPNHSRRMELYGELEGLRQKYSTLQYNIRVIKELGGLVSEGMIEERDNLYKRLRCLREEIKKVTYVGSR